MGQERRGSTRRAGQRERRGNDEGVEAAGRRERDFYHAARGLHSGDGDEPYHSSSRAADGVLPFAGCPGAGALRSERRRRAAGGSGSRREIRSPAGGGERSAPRVFPARASFLASLYNEAHGSSGGFP